MSENEESLKIIDTRDSLTLEELQEAIQKMMQQRPPGGGGGAG